MSVLVTGGSGFVGLGIVRRLLEHGFPVRSLTRSESPVLNQLGVEQHLGRLDDAAVVDRAVAGCEAIFHVAAKAGVWGSYQDYYATNVTGTLNIIQACRRHGIHKLIYTSTPSVVHRGESLCGADESLPYPTHFEAAYPATKAEAERAVLQANSGDLATVALRPHLIWGPGDPHLIPRVLQRAKAGQLRRIGAQPVIVDVTYIDNVVDAHWLAFQRLTPSAPAAGRAYFISNDEPVDLWEFLNRVLELAHLPPVTRVMAPWKAKLAGTVLEWVYRLLRLRGEPRMTRFVASQLCTSHWYNISAAKRDLGYSPRITITEGLRRLAKTFGDHSSSSGPIKSSR